MLNLTNIELDNAFSAINHHGYSTMLPDPPEWEVVKRNWPAVRTVIEQIDLDTYEPYSVTKVFAPKSRANIRIVHLLHPQDLIIYTALTLIAKSDIEINRVSTKSRRVFSYRASPNDELLYDTKDATPPIEINY